jgi:hypothetical protein
MSVGQGSFRAVSGPGDVPAELLDHLRPICLGFPEAYEEPAWTGTRWRIRKRTFAHVLTVDPEHERAYARAAKTDEPVSLMTFRAPMGEIGGLIASGYPFFKPDWGPDVVGMFLEDRVDWAEVAELLTDSYCILAPKKLAKLVADRLR